MSIHTPIYQGKLQSDLDVNHFNLLNFSGGGGGGSGLPAGWVSIMDYGGVADGVTDNTSAVQAAIAAATAAVYFPPGNYFFSGTIGAVPKNISLVGSFQGPHGTVSDATIIYDHSNQLSPLAGGTTFMVTANSGNGSAAPFISLTDNCAVVGITFYWPNQSAVAVTPTAYPWAIKLNGSTAGSVQYCYFVNAYQGIYLENTINSLVEECRGQMLYRGIKCEGNYDATRLRGIHFGAQWTTQGVGLWQLTNSIAFELGRNDYLILDNCFAYYYATWIHCYNDVAHNFHGPSSCWAAVRGGGADYCIKSIWIEECQSIGVEIDGIYMSSNIAGSLVGLQVDSSCTGAVWIRNSMLLIRNGVFGMIAGSGDVSVDNCYCWSGNGSDAATGWAVTSTGVFALRNNTFKTVQTHLNLGSGLSKAVVTGNMASGTFTVTNGMAAGTAVIGNNTGGDTVYVGTDARLVAISGGVKLEVRNTGTGVWVEATRYTNP